MARIAPGSLRQIGLPAFVMTRVAGRVMRTDPPAVFTTLARTRRTYWGWLGFAGMLMPFGALKRAESELVILRTAFRRDSDYEWAHHTLLGRRVGLTDEQIAAVRDEQVRDDLFTPREQVLLRATDELLIGDDLTEPTWAALREQLTERESIEALLLIGHYRMLATTLHTLRITPDRSRRVAQGT